MRVSTSGLMASAHFLGLSMSSSLAIFCWVSVREGNCLAACRRFSLVSARSSGDMPANSLSAPIPGRTCSRITGLKKGSVAFWLMVVTMPRASRLVRILA